MSFSLVSASTDGLAVWLRPDEQCVALTRDFRIIQRTRGHRYSVDDVLVAHDAGLAIDQPRRILDLGCGIGSVLLMLAWRFPTAELVGVEAHHPHAGLAARNIVLNDCADRVKVIRGDIRDEPLLRSLGTFDLVTGSPPYFDPAASTVCSDPNRACAQWELRGGIEAYVQAASWTLKPSGVFVVCSGATPEHRTPSACAQAALHPIKRQLVRPREDRVPFLCLWTIRREAYALSESPVLDLRHTDGDRSIDYIRIRESFGLPCSKR